MQEIVQKYYGETLASSADLQTNACCTDVNLPEYAEPLLRLWPGIAAITERFDGA